MEQVTALNPADILRPAPTAEPKGFRVDGGQVSQPAEMGANQQAALTEVARLRGTYGETPAEKRDALAHKITKLQRFAFGHGDKPADFMPGDPPPPDLREHDSLRDVFEAAAKPADAQQTERAVRHAVLNGAHPDLARETAALCAELELSEGHTKTVLDRVRSHAGKSADGIDVLEGRDFEIFAMEAARTIGGLEKLKAMRDKAAEYIESKGIAERLEAEGFWSSSLSLDPRFLIILANAGLSRGGK